MLPDCAPVDHLAAMSVAARYDVHRVWRMANENERSDSRVAPEADCPVGQTPDAALFVLDADRWSRFVELLDRPPRTSSPGSRSLFSKESVFSLA